MAAATNGRAVFLDRDGTLIELVHLLARADQVKLLPDVAPALARLKKAGFLLIVVTNQPVIARGLASANDVEQIHRRLQELLPPAARIDAFYICPHHPEGVVAELRAACDCRKPEPGLLLRAAREHNLTMSECFMVGDRDKDIEAGRRAGCQTVLVGAPAGEIGAGQATHMCANLAETADWILTLV
jgi:D-glycero-D-manno-heptose 1,7-bisphosphate phosphatase